VSKPVLILVVALGLTVALEESNLAAQGRGRGRAETFPTDAQMAQSQEAQRHIAAAMALAKSDLVSEAKMFCTATGPQRPALARQQAGLGAAKNYVVEPTRVFDNVYYIGFSDQNAWAIRTSDGIILIDTLNSTEEARDVLVPSLKKAGMDPAQIKYIIVMHGHPGQTDHTGGASYLQSTYGAKVMMAAADWDLVLPAQRPERPLAKRDMDAKDGQKLTLGDTTVTLAHAPGHTPGSLAVIVPVTHRGTPHTVMFMGGTQMPTRASLAAFEHVFNDFARPLKVESAMGTHAGVLQDTLGWMDTLRKDPAAPHPFLYGPERFDRYMSIMLECARARLAALESRPS
jgi:metallo-beta-lactamase class B